MAKSNHPWSRKIRAVVAKKKTEEKKAMSKTWYRKRDDVNAHYTARECGVMDRFQRVGKMIHEDDLPEVARVLGLTMPVVKDFLFSPTTLTEEYRKHTPIL